MKIQYCMFESRGYDLENGEYRTFGIRAMQGQECHVEIADISSDAAIVSHLAQLCNQLELDPIHLYDVAQDAIV